MEVQSKSTDDDGLFVILPSIAEKLGRAGKKKCLEVRLSTSYAE